jgi:hypothetical protein
LDDRPQVLEVQQGEALLIGPKFGNGGAHRHPDFSPAAPGRESPDKSPLTSAIITGTPAADSCSAITCSVLVLGGITCGDLLGFGG